MGYAGYHDNIEPKDQALWKDPEDYLKFEQATAGSLLVIKEG